MIEFSVRDISVHYGKNCALNDVSLPTLRAGDVLGLLGPNAAGKSTLMRAVTGAQNHKGTVQLNGKNRQLHKQTDWHNRVAFMPQTPPQGSALKPIELMWSAARSLGISFSDKQLADHIESIFDALELNDFAMKPLDALSGGKRQLVGLALCMLRQPQVLLLDEPTSALDLYWRMVVLDLVSEHVRSTGAIAIAALHDIDLAVRYCSHIAIIDQGKLVAAGAPAEVITRENLAKIYHIDADITFGPNNLPNVHINKPLRGMNNETLNINL